MKNRRQSTLLLLLLAGGALCAVMLAGALQPDAAADFSQKNLPPCLAHPFGTDWLGRDLFLRTLKGLSVSLTVGVAASLISAVAAVLTGVAAATGSKAVDGVITWLIDLVMGVPHILLIMLISLACGRGFWGVTLGVALSHWPALARVLRGEALQLRQAPYLQMARRMGVPWGRVLTGHIVPHLLPQLWAGLILQFPHAILHEASVTFLGFGLSPEQPAIGVILEESMGYLTTGRWWLALFPGLTLAATVSLFALAGERLRLLLAPASAQE